MAIQGFTATITAATVYAVPGPFSFPGEPRTEREALRLTIETAGGQSYSGVVFDSIDVPKTEQELVEMLPFMDGSRDVLASVRARDCILKPTWRQMDVLAGLVSAEDAVCAYIDYYAQLGQIPVEANELKSALRDRAKSRSDMINVLKYTRNADKLLFAVTQVLGEGSLL